MLGYTNNLIHVPSQFNASDIVSKNWGYQSVWKNILQPIFHWAGDTGNMYQNDDLDYFETIVNRYLMSRNDGEY